MLFADEMNSEVHRGLPLRISFHDVEHSDAVEAAVRRHAEKLFGITSKIVACNVAIEAPHRHKHHGKHYRVRIDLVVPGAELVADRSPDMAHVHENLYAAVDDAFHHAVRLLREHVGRREPRA
jgi:ribosome-associated translation inhibitor RaiA